MPTRDAGSIANHGGNPIAHEPTAHTRAGMQPVRDPGNIKSTSIL